jgi:hypothetical protein
MINTHKPHIKIIGADNTMLSIRITTWTNKEHDLLVDKQSFLDWADGKHIQNCFPDFDADIRELMISGMDLEQQAEFFDIEEEES